MKGIWKECNAFWLGFWGFSSSIKGSGGGALFLRRRFGPWNPGLYRHRLAGLGSQDFRFHHLGDAGGLLGPGKGKPHRIERDKAVDKLEQLHESNPTVFRMELIFA